MKPHSDKGRLLIAEAIIKSEWTSPWLKDIAIDCILAYKEEQK